MKVCGDGIEGHWFNDNISWRLGTGNKVLMWEDRWVSNLEKSSLGFMPIRAKRMLK